MPAPDFNVEGDKHNTRRDLPPIVPPTITELAATRVMPGSSELTTTSQVIPRFLGERLFNSVIVTATCGFFGSSGVSLLAPTGSAIEKISGPAMLGFIYIGFLSCVIKSRIESYNAPNQVTQEISSAARRMNVALVSSLMGATVAGAVWLTTHAVFGSAAETFDQICKWTTGTFFILSGITLALRALSPSKSPEN